jgi:hypothetical protein
MEENATAADVAGSTGAGGDDRVSIDNLEF